MVKSFLETCDRDDFVRNRTEVIRVNDVEQVKSPPITVAASNPVCSSKAALTLSIRPALSSDSTSKSSASPSSVENQVSACFSRVPGSLGATRP